MISEDKIVCTVGEYVRGTIQSINKPDIERVVDNYRKNVTQKFIPKEDDEIDDIPLWDGVYASVKYDGEFNVFCYKEGEYSFFMNSPNHRVVYGMPVNEDINEIMEDNDIEKAFIAGELIACPSGDFTEYGKVYDFSRIARAPENEEQLEKIGFRVFDVIHLNGESLLETREYGERFEIIKDMIGADQSERLAVVDAIHTKDKTQLKDFYDQEVEGKGAEGLVVRLKGRSSIGHKVKPVLSLDVVLMGMVNGNPGSRLGTDQVASTILGLRYPDGTYQIVTKCGGGLPDEERRKMWNDAEFVHTKGFTETSNDGRAYRMCKPEKVVKIKYGDLIETKSDMDYIMKNVLQYDEEDESWEVIRRVPFVSLRHPRFPEEYLRTDKSVDTVEDVRVSQITDRTTILEDLQAERIGKDLPQAQVLDRVVYRKKNKIRKLMLIETNKQDFGYLPFVVYYIYYTPDAKNKVQRKAKGLRDYEKAKMIFDKIRADEMDTGGDPKRGWKQVTP
ncbi:MAG: hypothetical protein GF309_05105 [Candidatus Lokiarchaeota archaeon]|nr:hypothetical protein [Candidatus Lokiarchaeota archaeon]